MNTLEKYWELAKQSNTVRLGFGQVIGAALAVLGGELSWRQGGVVAAIGVLQIIQREWKLKKEEAANQ
jgi:hypothetical protein